MLGGLAIQNVKSIIIFSPTLWQAQGPSTQTVVVQTGESHSSFLPMLQTFCLMTTGMAVLQSRSTFKTDGLDLRGTTLDLGKSDAIYSVPYNFSV